VDTSGEGGGRIFIRGGELVADKGWIFADTLGDGEGQGIDIGVAGQITMRNGALITTDNSGSGSGGDLTVKADKVFLSGHSSIHVIGLGTGSRDLGDITVTAGSLEVRNRATIFTLPTERGSNVTVTADRVFLSGDGATGFDGLPIDTGIFADGFEVPVGEPFEAGAGNITVTAGNLEVRNGAEISASIFSFGEGGNALGQGGNVKINATDITLQDGGRISAEAEGLAGAQADAGNITLEVRNLLHLSNDSSIIISARSEGSGGNIAIDSVFVVLDEGSSIIANAERGQGGNIFIRILGGGALFQSPDSRIAASSEVGLEGSVVIDAPDTDIIAGFAGLPVNFLDAASVLTELCAGRSGANVSSLVIRKYEVLPDSPYALRVQLPRAIPAPRTAKQSHTPRTYYAGSPLPPMISCLGNG
jgi:large exoprotein involved in heme utilization and adhesion